METKVEVLRRLCEKVTGESSTKTTISEVLADIEKNYNSEGSIPTKVSQLTNDSGFITADDVPVSANQADSEATELAELVTDFNALLTKLKAAGIMEADE